MQKTSEIKDVYHITHGVFHLLSTLTFVPHLFFSTATDYWMYKFRYLDDHPHHNHHHPYRASPTNHLPLLWQLPINMAQGEYNIPNKRTDLQVNFTASFGITSHLSMTVSLLLATIFFRYLPAPQKRITGALIFNLVLFLGNLATTVMNTDKVQSEFFTYSIILTIALNCSTSLVVVGLFELAIQFPPIYAASVLTGHSICGVLSSLIQIIMLTTHLHPQVIGAIYFSVGSMIILFATVLFVVIKNKSKYFIYSVGQSTKDAEIKAWSVTPKKIKSVIRKAKWYYATLFFVQASTAVVYPGMCVLIASTKKGSIGSVQWHETYFVPVITFFGFHIGNLIGRELAIKLKNFEMSNCLGYCKPDIILMIVAIIRVGFVPLLVLCNVQPRQHLPVIFDDNSYIAMLILFGFSEGLLLNICIIKISQCVKEEQKKEAFIMIPICTVLTVTLGASLTMFFLRIL